MATLIEKSRARIARVRAENMARAADERRPPAARRDRGSKKPRIKLGRIFFLQPEHDDWEWFVSMGDGKFFMYYRKPDGTYGKIEDGLAIPLESVPDGA